MRQRRLNTAYNLARDGGAKNIADAPIKPGMTRQTHGDLHPYLHGQSVDDEPMQKTYEKVTALHPATTPKQAAGVHPVRNDPSVILNDAANLGRPGQKA